MTRTWFVTGISRGLGRELAAAALAAGDVVIGTTRSGATPGGLDGDLRVLALDVDDPDAVERVVAAAIEIGGGLDVVVNNAGFGLLGPVESTGEAEVAAVLETNFVGPLRVIRAAAPHLRQRGTGTLVNVSSIAGLAPGAGSGVYAAAKAALSGLSEAVAAELEPFGVRVLSVEPGRMRTEFFTDSSVRLTAQQPGAYADTVGSLVATMTDTSGAEPGDPGAVARLILDAVRSDSPPRHLVVGADAIERTRAKLAALAADVDAWEARSIATACAPDA